MILCSIESLTSTDSSEVVFLPSIVQHSESNSQRLLALSPRDAQLTAGLYPIDSHSHQSTTRSQTPNRQDRPLRTNLRLPLFPLSPYCLLTYRQAHFTSTLMVTCSVR